MKVFFKYQNPILFIFIGLFFILQTFQPPQDIDLGWHLKYGEYFFQNGHVLKDNIYSFVWPSYKWVQASWGYDLLLYQIYNLAGFPGIAFAGMVITGLIFLIITQPLKGRSPFQIFILAVIFLSMASPLYGASLRSQTPSTLFFAIFISITYQVLTLNKTRLIMLMPLVFLFWANMHGGFALGLIIAVIFFITQGVLIWIKKITKHQFPSATPKTWLLYGGALLVSILTPLISPWGTRVYEETFKHSTNTNLTVITEWMPLYKMVPFESILTGIVVLIILGLAFKRRRIEDIPYVIVLLILTYMAYSAMRFLINFGTFLTFYTAIILPATHFKIFSKKHVKNILQIGLLLVILFDFLFTKRYFVFSDRRILTMDWNGWTQITLSGSEPIAKIMNENTPSGNGFHPYNFGGYLIWRVPQVKTFIDGRMAAWENDNGETPPIISGDEVIYKNGPLIFQKFAKEYDFQWAIVVTETPIDRYLYDLAKLNKWERRYQDYYFSYYVKNNVQN